MAREGLERNRPKIENARVIVYNSDDSDFRFHTERGEGGGLAYREQQYKTLTSGFIQKGGANKDDKHHCKT